MKPFEKRFFVNRGASKAVSHQFLSQHSSCEVVKDGAGKERWLVAGILMLLLASGAAGMTGIGVTTGVADPDALTAAGAAVTIGSLTTLLAELRRRGLPT